MSVKTGWQIVLFRESPNGTLRYRLGSDITVINAGGVYTCLTHRSSNWCEHIGAVKQAIADGTLESAA